MSSQLTNKNPTFKNVIDYLKNTPIIEEADVDKIAKVYIKTIPNFNGTQTTFNYSFVTNTMIPINMDLSNPKAQNGNWTISTNNGSITIQGNVTSNESTNITLYLMESIDKDSN